MTLLELLETWVAFYINIGVPLNEILYGDTENLRLYYIAHEKKVDTDFEKRNYELYLQGLYNFRAFGAALNDFKWWFNGGKGVHPEGYLEGVIPHTKHEKEIYEERENEKTRQYFMKGQGQ